MLINSSSVRHQNILARTVEDSMALERMVLVHSNEVLVGMNHSMGHDHSNSLLKKEPKLP
jgi:hypothetical protein